MRRDHAKYLALIAALALLHQHQRKHTTRTRGGTAERCVIAAPQDLQLAQQLSAAALARRLDALLPHTRQLLARMEAYVQSAVSSNKLTREQLRFSQRELREALGYADRALRRQLSRLVELEYVVMHRAGLGNRRRTNCFTTARVKKRHPGCSALSDVAAGNGHGHGKHAPRCSGLAAPPAGTEPAV